MSGSGNVGTKTIAVRGAFLTAIELEDLRVSYRGRRGSVVAVDKLSLSVPTGGVFGFLGANGAGKTTAIRAIVGLLRSSTGRIRVLTGETAPDARAADEHEPARAVIGAARIVRGDSPPELGEHHRHDVLLEAPCRQVGLERRKRA